MEGAYARQDNVTAIKEGLRVANSLVLNAKVSECVTDGCEVPRAVVDNT